MGLFLRLLLLSNVVHASWPWMYSTTMSSTPAPPVRPTSTHKHVSTDAELLHQILAQETTLRMELERNVRSLMKDVEEIKKGQAAAETKINELIQENAEQNILNQRLVNNISMLFKENEYLSEELKTFQVEMINKSSNSLFHAEPRPCECKNVSKEIQNFKREVRYISLSFFDLQRKTELMNASILQTINDSISTISQEVSNISISVFDLQGETELLNVSMRQTINNVGFISDEVAKFFSDISNLSKTQDQERHHQNLINAELKSRQQNDSIIIKEQLEKEVLNLTTKFFELENQEILLALSFKDIEKSLSKIDVLINDSVNFQKTLRRMQREQMQLSTDMSYISNGLQNVTLNIQALPNKVAFSATIISATTSHSGDTLIFPHILCNVGGGYDSKNGIFTAPIDGIYVFFNRITGASDNTGDLLPEFVLNGVPKTRSLVYARSTELYRSSSNLIVLRLNRGDRVWVKMYQGGSLYSYGSGGDQSFSGYLL